MATRSFVTAILLLGAVACGGKDTLPTQPTPVPQPVAAPPVPATDIVGDYHLTFSASPSCSLPREFMKRSYRANVKAWVNLPNGVPNVLVEVSGGTFYQYWSVGFQGRRDGDSVRFTIVGVVDDFGALIGGDPGLAEVIDGTKWLTYDGSAVNTVAANNIETGTFDGLIKLRDAISGATLVECRATDHKIEFAR